MYICDFNHCKRCRQMDETQTEESLNIENTLWANTVVASGTAVGLVIYTGPETRSVMNTSQPKSKVLVTVCLDDIFVIVEYGGSSSWLRNDVDVAI